MTTETQLTEIRNYLLSKKLPIDILIEVNDHFVSQISDLQRDENLNFEEAFEKVKESWGKELKPYWRGNLNLEDISDFMIKTKKEIDKSNFSFAIKYSILPFLMVFIFAFYLEPKSFSYLTFTLLLGLFLYSLSNYYSHYQDFKIAKKYKKYVLTLHQNTIFIFIILISPMMNIYSRFFNEPEKLQKLMTFRSNKPVFVEIVFIFMSVYLIIFCVFFSISSQKKYLEQIQKVKPFLKYL